MLLLRTAVVTYLGRPGDEQRDRKLGGAFRGLGRVLRTHTRF